LSGTHENKFSKKTWESQKRRGKSPRRGKTKKESTKDDGRKHSFSQHKSSHIRGEKGAGNGIFANTLAEE